MLDDCDQRYQLSLGLTKCAYSNKNTAKKSNNTSAGSGSLGSIWDGAVLDIELCLLAMEEDEVDDSGFPTFVNEGDDDEALICTGNDRIHTCIESSVRVVPMSALLDQKKEPTSFGKAKSSVEAIPIREVPLSRGMIGQDGAVRFRIDLKKALDSATMLNVEGGGDAGDGARGSSARFQIVKLRFCHADTGAILELRLPAESDTDKGGSNGEIEFCGISKPAVARNDASRYLLDDHHDDEEHDEPNEYDEEDGFVVNGSQDSEEEFDSHEEEEDDEEDGVCQICENGGDLIVCDGGDHEGGCGLAYHILCIGRSMIPPGEFKRH